jgi:hypothetical protein
VHGEPWSGWMLAHGSIYNFVGTGPVRTYFCNNTRSFYGEMRVRLPAMALRALCTEPVPTGRNMTLAQLCCTCWALAALAELGVQGPESVPTDQLNFLAVACIAMFPASRKRCEKVVVFGAQNPIYPEMSGCLNALIFGEKGVLVVVADVHSYRFFHCLGIWIFPVGNEN